MKSYSREIETVFLICSERPQVVARQLAELTVIGKYLLLSEHPQEIHDRYFDTPACSLYKKRLAFRLREVSKTAWLTLKSSAQLTAEGGVERLEVEVRWSRMGLTRIVNELKDRGVKLRSPRKVDYARPLEALKRLGFKLIQNRENHRVLKNIVRKGATKGSVLAELAIDSVVYHFSKQDIRLYEIEIESKSSTGPRVVRTVRDALVVQSGSALRWWSFGKLATGRAIETLLRAGKRKDLFDAANNLKPSAYETIAAYLTTGNI